MQPDTKSKRLSPLHAYHESKGARFDLRAGWLIPEVYTASSEETAALRESVGLVDISARGKLIVKGDLAEVVIGTRWEETPKNPGDVSVVKPNDILIARLTMDELLILTSPGDESEIADSLEREIATRDFFVTVIVQTSSLVGLSLLGPKSVYLMRKLCALPFNPKAFPNLCVAQSSFAKTRATIIRHDRGETLAFELYADRSYGSYLWDAIMDAGREFSIQPVGWSAVER